MKCYFRHFFCFSHKSNVFWPLFCVHFNRFEPKYRKKYVKLFQHFIIRSLFSYFAVLGNHNKIFSAFCIINTHYHLLYALSLFFMTTLAHSLDFWLILIQGNKILSELLASFSCWATVGMS